MTVADRARSPEPAEREQAVTVYARDVWAAWQPHHSTIGRWAERAFAAGDPD